MNRKEPIYNNRDDRTVVEWNVYGTMCPPQPKVAPGQGRENVLNRVRDWFEVPDGSKQVEAPVMECLWCSVHHKWEDQTLLEWNVYVTEFPPQGPWILDPRYWTLDTGYRHMMWSHGVVVTWTGGHMMWSPEETVLSWGDSFVLERQLFFGRYSFSTVCLSYQEKGGTGLHPACILNGIIFSSSKYVLCLEVL
jgi:hypothetical protein